ncbi:MAG: hypothetical protein MZV63_37480 [Marinilabiliales bacterium]|nr:hypothetical protein [Marinilabiliales bacterium]
MVSVALAVDVLVLLVLGLVLLLQDLLDLLEAPQLERRGGAAGDAALAHRLVVLGGEDEDEVPQLRDGDGLRQDEAAHVAPLELDQQVLHVLQRVDVDLDQHVVQVEGLAGALQVQGLVHRHDGVDGVLELLERLGEDVVLRRVQLDVAHQHVQPGDQGAPVDLQLLLVRQLKKVVGVFGVNLSNT